MKIYSLKSGKRISISPMPRPREGDVVFFTKEEWAYIKAMGWTDEHKLFLWNAKYDNFRYPIIPEKGLTEAGMGARYCREILASLKKKTG